MDLITFSQRNPSIKNILLFSILTNSACVVGVLYSNCYEHETYCLFSFGPNVTVNNVKEAQKICEDAKNGSWLLEIADNRTLKNVEGFLSNHQFPDDTKLLLNAERIGNNWKWIKNKSEYISDTTHSIIDNGDVKFYRQKQTAAMIPEGNEYQIICMTVCYSNLTIFENSKYPVSFFRSDTSKGECLAYCEQSECSAWEWRDDEDDYSSNGCYIHKTISGNMISSIGTLFVMDRSVKRIDICIGNVTEPDVSATNSATIILISTLVPLFLLIGIIMIIGNILKQLKTKQNLKRDTLTENSITQSGQPNENLFRNSYLSLTPSIESYESAIYAKQTTVSDRSETYEQVPF